MLAVGGQAAVTPPLPPSVCPTLSFTLSLSCCHCWQWDEAVLTMSLGEKAEIIIEPEWGYGKRGLEGKYPFIRNSQLNESHSLVHC